MTWCTQSGIGRIDTTSRRWRRRRRVHSGNDLSSLPCLSVCVCGLALGASSTIVFFSRPKGKKVREKEEEGKIKRRNAFKRCLCWWDSRRANKSEWCYFTLCLFYIYLWVVVGCRCRLLFLSIRLFLDHWIGSYHSSKSSSSSSTSLSLWLSSI